ncbi:MAG: diacylglycerol kinase [Candidatus Omnitrophota bacterium]
MKQGRLVDSFNSAIEGFIYVFKTQRNMRLHFLIGLSVILLGLILNFTNLEIIALCLTITFVLFAEMLNTALEHTIDLIKEEFHPLARIIKDICAGAVLLGAISSIVVGYILFTSRVGFRLEQNIIKIRGSSWHLTFIVLIFVLALVVFSKIGLNSGTPFRGGMPSGHSAVSFSIWTIISLLYPNRLVIFLVFILAFLVARSRIKDKVHSWFEVFIGSSMGVLVTLLLFQLLRG